MTGSADALICPSCAAGHGSAERFCTACGMPLVRADAAAGDERVSEAHRRARKVKRSYLDGPLTKVAGARHQGEAELIQGLLLEEGVPSTTRRSAGFDVPDMLFSGPRDVLVPLAAVEAAHEVLGSLAPVSLAAPLVGTTRPHTRALALGLAITLAVAGLTPLGVTLWTAVH